ncbi:calumenin-like [Tropilaelaps mercedesae]|uniref:Reticulocalbin-3 n=1 Tax=Tropilaelaps mercedesae TaxID=418985 RepID=A0A1V9Y0V8_9ACAR|nr:calumenin-like [Tropilaelaps mercedesae]
MGRCTTRLFAILRIDTLPSHSIHFGSSKLPAGWLRQRVGASSVCAMRGISALEYIMSPSHLELVPALSLLTVSCLLLNSACVALPKHFSATGSRAPPPNSDLGNVPDSGEAKELRTLSPEENRNRLAAIFDKIDKDTDGLLTQDELSEWIHRVARKNIEAGTRRKWRQHNPYGSSRLSWQDYRKSMYGLPIHWDEDKHPQQGPDGQKVNQMMRADRRRWLAADQDGDEMLNIEEFEAFLYPEEKEHMAEVVAIETLETVDKNGDGTVDLNEYIEDIFPDLGDGPLPDYARDEVELFRSRRDTNKDGRLDLREMIAYTHRSEDDHPEAEALHLVHSADKDADGRLSKQEVLENYDIFVGGQVTDYGEALLDSSNHDEF